MLPKNCTQNSAKFAVKYMLTSANLLKKRLRHSCFPLNYADISSRPFCITVVSIHSPNAADFFIYTRLVQKLTEENG